jgi:hypothetical protein
MALEPRNATANASNPELDDKTRHFWIGVVLTIPLLAVMVSDILPGHPLQHLLPWSLARMDRGRLRILVSRRYFFDVCDACSTKLRWLLVVILIKRPGVEAGWGGIEMLFDFAPFAGSV